MISGGFASLKIMRLEGPSDPNFPLKAERAPESRGSLASLVLGGVTTDGVFFPGGGDNLGRIISEGVFNSDLGDNLIVGAIEDGIFGGNIRDGDLDGDTDADTG